MVAFKKADTGWLKNGGPDLLVSAIDGEIVTCIWHSAGTPKQAQFETILLASVRPTAHAIDQTGHVPSYWRDPSDLQKSDDLPNRRLTIEKGDNVWLKNGGPDLLVSAIDGEIVTCIWFSKSLLKKATYESVLLTKTSLAKAATEEIDKLMNEWCQASSSLPPE